MKQTELLSPFSGCPRPCVLSRNPGICTQAGCTRAQALNHGAMLCSVLSEQRVPGPESRGMAKMTLRNWDPLILAKCQGLLMMFKGVVTECLRPSRGSRLRTLQEPGVTRKVLEGEASVIRSCHVLSFIDPKHVSGATQYKIVLPTLTLFIFPTKKTVMSNYKWLFVGKKRDTIKGGFEEARAKGNVLYESQLHPLFAV